MGDLSSYIDFNVKLDKSLSTPAIVLTDPDNYPGSIGLYIKGVFSVTQPDGISVVGNFLTPDIYWSGSSLVTNSKELRLATDGNFQNGIYTITYTVQCTGYDDTILTKTFNLVYTPVVLSITDLTDPFTPSVKQLDSTIYLQNNFNSPSTTSSWSAAIDYAGTSVGNITGSALLFDMIYSGVYWDARFAVNYISTTSYIMTASTWVTIVDKFTANYNVDVYTPPTMSTLLSQLTTMKQEVDNGTYCGGNGCGCGCSDEQAFLNAQSLYNLLKTNGCNDVTIGIYQYITEMQKLFTCNGAITQIHLNAPLTNYNFGCGSGGNVTPPIQFTVDSGALYAPISGTANYNNPTLSGNTSYTIFRQAVGNFLVQGIDFTFNAGGGFTLTNSSSQGVLFISQEQFTLVFH